MSGHTHLWLYQFEETFDVCLLVKNQLDIPFFSGCIAKIFYELIVLGTLGMLSYAQLKLYYQTEENFCAYLQLKNKLHPILFWR